MSSIMGQIEPEHPQLFALEFGKIAETDFLYTVSSTNIDQSAPTLVKMYVIIRSRMSSIMDLIGPELSELNCPWIRKFAIFDFGKYFQMLEYKQSVPNLATIYLSIRSRMNLIMEQIKPEHRELFALEFGNWNWLCLHSSISKYLPVSTKLGQTVCDHKISIEFDYGFNWSRTV